MDNLWSPVNAIMLYPYDINKYKLMFMIVKISLALKAKKMLTKMSVKV